MPPATRSLASARQCSIHLHSLRSTGIESGIHAKGIERCWRDNERSIERRKLYKGSVNCAKEIESKQNVIIASSSNTTLSKVIPARFRSTSQLHQKYPTLSTDQTDFSPTSTQ